MSIVAALTAVTFVLLLRKFYLHAERTDAPFEMAVRFAYRLYGAFALLGAAEFLLSRSVVEQGILRTALLWATGTIVVTSVLGLLSAAIISLVSRLRS